MCGIVGLVQWHTGLEDSQSLLKMADAIRHRGPDDVGYIFGNTHTGDFAFYGGADTPEAVWSARFPHTPAAPLQPTSIAASVYHLGMANRRLSIVDLSPAGHQPLCNEDRTLWVVFNGELYNLPELRAELTARGHTFISHSDTELLLHAYETWGAECVTHFNGMWAFALWDIRRRQLLLARDRVGIKPLYFWRDAHRLAFASEIKSLLALDIPRRAHPQAVYDFLVGNLSDHTPATFFAGIETLPPAHTMTVDLLTGQTKTQRYWAVDLTRRAAFRSDDETTAAFRDLFEDAVRVHLLSDVPVGTCLSGGLDSSAVVCMIDRLLRQRGVQVVGMESRQKTFSARYHDSPHDEGRYIEAVAQACAVDARMVYPAPGDLARDWERVFYHLEEPFGSTSIFAQWNVFQLARASGVTVTLDGQGADELLAGYRGFPSAYFADLVAGGHLGRFWAEWRAHTALHGASPRRELQNTLSGLLPAAWKTALKRQRRPHPAWLAPALYDATQAAPEAASSGGTRLARALHTALTFSPLPSLLRFDDRNSMAHSIESRVPYLDYRLIEFCFALPPEQKIRAGTTKYILRQALRDVIPDAVFARQDKVHFTTPQAEWLRGDLAAWVRDSVNTPELQHSPYLMPAAVRQMAEQHLNGVVDHTGLLWRCLAVISWQRIWNLSQ